jgi:F420-dependent methylenetetrahydromethanopterin dehydrogenase
MRVVEMDVGVILNVFACWVIGDVEELIVVVASICDAVGVVAVLPDFSREVFAKGEGEASLD